MRTQCFLSAVAAASIYAGAATAAERLDPMVITATGDEALLSTLAPSVTVIDREEIERLQPNDLADMLRTVAGVDVVRSGGPGAPASIFMRGTESNHVLFLVDGVRYTTETFLNAQLQNLSPEMIERVEVVKGPRSALYGSDAIGGVVHVITRRTAGRGTHGNASVRGGSYGTRDTALGVSHGAERYDASLQIEAQEFAGFPPLHDGKQDRGHRGINAAVQLGRELAGTRLSGRYWMADGRNEYVDPFTAENRSQDFRNQVSAVEWAYPVFRNWDARLVASHARDELSQNEPGDPARPQAFSFTHVERRGLEWHHELRFAALTSQWGLSTSRSRISSSHISGFGDSHIQDATARHAVFTQLSVPTTHGAGLLALRYTDHGEFGPHFSGNIEWSMPAWRGARVAALAGTAFKEPELTDLHGMFGNPELQPERSRSYELNLRQTLGHHQALTAAIHYTDVLDLLASNPITFKTENIERAHIRGLELGWRYERGAWSARLGGHLQDPRNEQSGAQLLRRSERALSAELVRQFGSWQLSLDGLAQDERWDTGDARLAGYGLLNAQVRHQPWPGFAVALRGENLFDKAYELVDGYRSAGRAAYLSVRSSF